MSGWGHSFISLDPWGWDCSGLAVQMHSGAQVRRAGPLAACPGREESWGGQLAASQGPQWTKLSSSMIQLFPATVVPWHGHLTAFWKQKMGGQDHIEASGVVRGWIGIPNSFWSFCRPCHSEWATMVLPGAVEGWQGPTSWVPLACSIPLVDGIPRWLPAGRGRRHNRS